MPHMELSRVPENSSLKVGVSHLLVSTVLLVVAFSPLNAVAWTR